MDPGAEDEAEQRAAALHVKVTDSTQVACSLDGQLVHACSLCVSACSGAACVHAHAHTHMRANVMCVRILRVCGVARPRTRTHTHTHTHTHTLSHAHTHTLSLSLSHTHTQNLQLGAATQVDADTDFKVKVDPATNSVSCALSRKLRPELSVLVTGAINGKKLTDATAHRWGLQALYEM